MSELTKYQEKKDPRSKLEKATLSEEHDLEIFNLQNEFSLINKMPSTLADELKRIDSNLLALSDTDLREKVRPTSTLNKLRLAFWVEYDMACRLGKKMTMRRIYAGICSREHFSTLAHRPKNLAWLIQPVASYQSSLEEVLLDGVAQMHKIINFPLYKRDKDGNKVPDTSAANLVMKAYEKVDQRLHGAVVQKLEMKQLSIKKDLTENGRPVDVDQELAKIRSQVQEKEQIVHKEEVNDKKEIIEIEAE